MILAHVDYECCFCQTFAAHLKKIQKNENKSLRCFSLNFRNFRMMNCNGACESTTNQLGLKNNLFERVSSFAITEKNVELVALFTLFCWDTAKWKCVMCVFCETGWWHYGHGYEGGTRFLVLCFSKENKTRLNGRPVTRARVDVCVHLKQGFFFSFYELLTRDWTKGLLNFWRS